MTADNRVLADLAKEVNETGKLVAATAAHVEHLMASSEEAWKKLDALDDKVDSTARDILSQLPCAERKEVSDRRFTKLEIAQGVTTTKVAALIAGVFVALETVMWGVKLTWGVVTKGSAP